MRLPTLLIAPLLALGVAAAPAAAQDVTQLQRTLTVRDPDAGTQRVRVTLRVPAIDGWQLSVGSRKVYATRAEARFSLEPRLRLVRSTTTITRRARAVGVGEGPVRAGRTSVRFSEGSAPAVFRVGIATPGSPFIRGRLVTFAGRILHDAEPVGRDRHLDLVVSGGLTGTDTAASRQLVLDDLEALLRAAPLRFRELRR